jgi:hypothetical protein
MSLAIYGVPKEPQWKEMDGQPNLPLYRIAMNASSKSRGSIRLRSGSTRISYEMNSSGFRPHSGRSAISSNLCVIVKTH